MNTLELLQINLYVAHDAFLKTVEDLTQANVDWIPAGQAHPIGERYAHTVAAEDSLVNGIAKGGAPWYTSEWAGKTGFRDFQILLSVEQAQAFHVELPLVHEYARAVFAASQDYFNSLSVADLDRNMDMSAVGFGIVPFPAWASAFVIGHLHDLMGEISALKGLQGLKGYPF